jgi:DNA-binding NtrC family response regulator
VRTQASATTRVLIVDDDLLIRWVLAQTLADRGCIVVEAKDGRSARQAIVDSTPPFDVVLLDYRLPDSRDLALLRAVRRLSPRSRVLMMSAYMDAHVAEDAGSDGAVSVLEKPLDLDAVCALALDAHTP